MCLWRNRVGGENHRRVFLVRRYQILLSSPLSTSQPQLPVSVDHVFRKDPTVKFECNIAVTSAGLLNASVRGGVPVKLQHFSFRALGSAPVCSHKPSGLVVSQAFNECAPLESRGSSRNASAEAHRQNKIP